MKRFTAALATLALSACLGLALAGDAAAGKAGGKSTLVAYQGWITDEWCGVKNANADGKDCAIDCYKKGSKLVLYVPDGNRKILLVDQKQAAEHIGAEVKVSGMMDGESLKATKIEEVKKG